MKGFKSAGQAQRFLFAHDQISNLFLLRRDHLLAAQYRAARNPSLPDVGRDHRRCRRGIALSGPVRAACTVSTTSVQVDGAALTQTGLVGRPVRHLVLSPWDVVTTILVQALTLTARW